MNLKEQNTQILIDNKINFISKNNGLHLILDTNEGIIDYWPSANKWKHRNSGTTRKDININRMLKFITTEDFADRTDYVLVPKSELLKLEEARKQLYKLLGKQLDDVYFHAAFTSITGQIWDVANTKDWKMKI